MQKKNNKKVLIAIGVIALVVVICILLLLFEKNADSSKVIVKDNVFIITSETPENKMFVQVTDSELVFSDEQKYMQGDVIVSGITELAPAGFIRRVIETDVVDGKYVVRTENGVLTDVFEKAHIEKTFLMTEEGITEIEPDNVEQVSITSKLGNIACADFASKYISNLAAHVNLLPVDDDEYQYMMEFEYDLGHGISATGEVGFSVWIEMEIDIQDNEVEFAVIAHDESGGSITFGIGADGDVEFEKVLLNKNLPNYEFIIGTVPVVITNELQVDVQGEVHLEGSIGTTLGIDASGATGFRYNSVEKNVEEIRERNYLTDELHWDTQAEANGGNAASINLGIISKLYDCTGVDLSVGIGEEIEGTVCLKLATEDDNRNFIGCLDMAVMPIVRGDLVVTSPVIDRELVNMPLFEVELEPFWERHWESSANWQDELEKLKPVELCNTYTTRFGAENMVTAPEFSFDFPENWKITMEQLEISSFAERDVLTNERGVTITYFGLNSIFGIGGYGRTMYEIDISKVADSSFAPENYSTDPNDPEYTNYGTYVVAKIKITGCLDMDSDIDFTDIDGGTMYAVVPETNIGSSWAVGYSGLYEECAFPFPIALHGIIAEAPNGEFTAREEKEVIAILSSFRESERLE